MTTTSEGPTSSAEQGLADEPLDLFGYRSGAVRWALAAFGAAYVVVSIATGTHMGSVLTWTILAAAFVGFVVATALTVSAIGRISVQRTVAVIAIVLVVCAIAWWRLTIDSATPQQYSPVVGAAIVILTLLAQHGRPVLASLGMLALTGIAAIHGPGPDWGLRPALVATISGYPMIAVASLFVVIMRPMEARIQQMRGEAIRAAATRAASEARAAERDGQLRRLDARARPILQQIVDGHRFTAAEVARVRLVESELRDGIRAAAWDTEAVREAVWAARERGVSVILLDDGALDSVPVPVSTATSDPGDTIDDAGGLRDALRARLIAELGRAPAGRITARVLPPGRELVASIVIDGGPDGSRRLECDGRGVIAWSEQGEGHHGQFAAET